MSGFARVRNVCLAVAATVAAALGVFVSTSAGSSSSRASTRHAAAYRTVRVRSLGRYVYPASGVVVLPAGKSAAGTIKCPAAHPHPVAGQFNESTGHVFLAASYATSTGGWYTALTNAGSTSAKTVIGAVCAP